MFCSDGLGGNAVYAIVETGGKQYKVSAGQTVDVELLPEGAGEQVQLDRVLMIVDGDSVQVGQPTVDGATVKAKVVDRIKGKKIRTFKYRGTNYRRRRGHRQQYTRLEIQEIVL
jgi:large subunit ribosomal protein L21